MTARNGLADLDAATIRMPGWIVRGMVFRLLAMVSLLFAPLALPWTTVLTIPLRVVPGTSRATGTVPDIARGAVGAAMPVEAWSHDRPPAIGRVVAVSGGAGGAQRIVVDLPAGSTARRGPTRARIVVRRGRLVDAIFGGIVATMRRR